MDELIQCFDVGHGGEVGVAVIGVGLGLSDERGAFSGAEPGEVEGGIAADDAGEDIGAHVAAATAGAVGDVAVGEAALPFEVSLGFA